MSQCADCQKIENGYNIDLFRMNIREQYYFPAKANELFYRSIPFILTSMSCSQIDF